MIIYFDQLVVMPYYKYFNFICIIVHSIVMSSIVMCNIVMCNINCGGK